MEQQLRETLEDLHRELEETETVDGQSRALLADVMRDIQHVLEETGEHDPPTLLERLREATRSFEESHPQLAAVAGRVADALANMGI